MDAASERLEFINVSLHTIDIQRRLLGKLRVESNEFVESCDRRCVARVDSRYLSPRRCRIGRLHGCSRCMRLGKLGFRILSTNQVETGNQRRNHIGGRYKPSIHQSDLRVEPLVYNHIRNSREHSCLAGKCPAKLTYDFNNLRVGAGKSLALTAFASTRSGSMGVETP